MKLKKIVSLALAGVLAVSMLAGCKNDGTSNSGSSSSEIVATKSNAVEYANYMLSGEAKNIFTFKADSELDAALKAAAENKSKLPSSKIETIYGSISVSSTNVSDVLAEIKNDLGYFFVNDFKDDATTNGPQSVIVTYGISGLRTEEEAVKSAMNLWLDKIGVNRTNYPAVDDDSVHQFSYEAAVSALKVASADHPSESAWVVTILTTRTAEDVQG